MKNFTLLALLATANGAVIQMEPRQAPTAMDTISKGMMNAMAGMLSKRKAFKIEEIPAKNAGAKRMKIIYGPYQLRSANGRRLGNGFSMDKGGESYYSMVDEDFPTDVTVLETFSSVVDENFKRATTGDGIYNHHNVFIDMGKSTPMAYTCESGRSRMAAQPAAVFSGGATEVSNMVYGATIGDVKTGYYINKDRKMLNMLDVINYNNVERTIYTHTEIEYVSGKPPGFIEAHMQLIDPGQCSGAIGAFIVPPKGVSKFQVNSTGIVAAMDGYMINLKGHLHDGGLNILITVNGKEVCNSQALYGGESHTSKTADGKVWETIRETTTCTSPVKVVKGDKIFMQANYDLDLHPSREMGGGHGGMGMKNVANIRASMDGIGAEQMALVATYFAPL